MGGREKGWEGKVWEEKSVIEGWGKKWRNGGNAGKAESSER